MRITLGTNGIYLVKVIKDGKEVRTIKVLKNDLLEIGIKPKETKTFLTNWTS